MIPEVLRESLFQCWTVEKNTGKYCVGTVVLLLLNAFYCANKAKVLQLMILPPPSCV